MPIPAPGRPEPGFKDARSLLLQLETSIMPLVANSLLLMVSIALSLGGIEAAARLYTWHTYGRWDGTCKHYVDPLGWDVRPDCKMAGEEADFLGQRYHRTYTTNSVGARWHSPVEAPSLKIMIVGDSFTEAREVDDRETYYAELARRTGFEVMAYGVGGYSSLQELMKTRQLSHDFAPQVFVLQFCFNDFQENSLDTTKLSVVENMKLRPYWDNGNVIYYRNGAIGRLYKLALRYSIGFNAVDRSIQRYRYARNGYSEYDREDSKIVALRRPDEIKITTEILRQFERVLPARCDRYAFNCWGRTGRNGAQQDYADFVEAAGSAGFAIIDGVAQAAADYERGAPGRTIRVEDGFHLNAVGNTLWGRFLADYLKQRYPARAPSMADAQGR